ncbi:tRNA(Ile)-lysidine synthetase, partial [Oceanidesulfovibrio marinus]
MLEFLRRQLERGLRKQKLFDTSDSILLAISGGKDSLALARELKSMEYDLTSLNVDLVIPGSSEKARAGVEAVCQAHDLPLVVVALEEEGIPIPEVKRRIHRPICSVCGKVKRSYFN